MSNDEKRIEVNAMSATRASDTTYQDPKDYMDAPYSFNMVDNESVVLNSGALQHTVTDFVLPGKNGFDFRITRKYDSSCANENEMTPKYENAEGYLSWVECSTISFSYNGRAFTHRNLIIRLSEDIPLSESAADERGRKDMETERSFYFDPHGIDIVYYAPKSNDGNDPYREFFNGYVTFGGQQLTEYLVDKPDIRNVGTFSYELRKVSMTNMLMTGSRANDHFTKYYGLGYGWSFVLPSIEVVDEDAVRTGWYSYKSFLHVEDGRIFEVENSNTLKKHPQKDVELLNTSGTLTHPHTTVTRNYNRAVKYKNGSIDYFNQDYSSERVKQCRLVGRRDRFGNTILFTKMDNTGMDVYDSWGRLIQLVRSGSTMTWNLPNGTIQYTTNGTVLTRAVDQVGRVTTYEYERRPATSRFRSENYGDYTSISRYFQLLTAIVHPTGARTEYSYRTATPLRLIFNEYGGYQDTFPLSSRKDIAGGNIYNEAGYTYAISGSSTQYVSSATVRRGDELVELNEFNSEHMKTHYRLSRGSVNILDDTYQYGSNDKQNDYRLITVEISRQYNAQGSYAQKTTNYTYYDNLCNVKKIEEIYAQDNDKHYLATEMTYGANSLLTGKSYQKDGSATIKEDYTLKDGKAVELATISENNVVKQKTGYTYDSAYNATEERRYYGNLTTQYHSTRFEYGARTPQPTKKTVGSSVFAYTYDEYGRVLTQTDGDTSHVTKFEYDGIGRVTKETHPDDGVKTNRYVVSATANYIDATDERGNTQRLTYTPLGKIQGAAILIGSTPQNMREYTYNSRNLPATESTYNVVSATSRTLTSTTAYTYDHLDRPTGKVVKSNAGLVLYQESVQYNDAVESKYFMETKTVGATTASSAAIVTAVKKDQRGNVVSETVGNKTGSFTYDKLGNKLSATDPKGYAILWKYNHAGQVTEERKQTLNIAATTEYDALGNKTGFTDYKGSKSDYTYDAAGRPLSETVPFETGKKTVTSYTYDAAGNVLKQRITDSPSTGFSRETEYTYDKCNRVVDTIQKDGAAEYRTRSIYDKAGNKTEVYTGMLGNSLSGARKTVYTYSRLGKVESMTDPQGYTERYGYSESGRLNSKTDRNGSVTAYGYDGLERLTSESVTATNAHGSTTSTQAYTYDTLGQKLTETLTEAAPEGTTTMSGAFVYDNRGLLTKQTDQADETVVKQYGYDDNGNRASFTLQRNGTSEMSMGYTYDSLNRLSTVSRSGSVIAQYGYDNNGNRIKQTYSLNSVETAYQYNLANLVTSLENKRGSTVVSKYTYAYYPDGNQKAKTDLKRTISYEYDGLGRLKKESDPDWNTIAYTYDPFGNREKMSVTGGETYTTTYAYSANNWLLTETKEEKDAKEAFRYQYDKNGDQCYREWERMEAVGIDGPGRVGFAGSERMKTREKILELRSYNGFGQLVWLYRDGDVTTYRYRPDGLRHSKTTKAGSTVHHWDGQNIVMEVTANGNSKSRFFRGINLIAQEIDGALQYYLFNAHGDVAQRLDGNGTVLKAYDYNAFGVEREAVDTDPNPFRYCGEYWDKESEEYYLRARYYQPRTGRFGAEDVAKDGLNWYTYCGNNPIRFADRSGKVAQVILGILGTALEALAALATAAMYVVAAVATIIVLALFAKAIISRIDVIPPEDSTKGVESFPIPEESGPDIETFPSPEQTGPDIETFPIPEQEKQVPIGPTPYQQHARDNIMTARTDHADERSEQGRPVSSALRDAQNAGRSKVLVQEDGRWIILGDNGRVHVFDGDVHVTTFKNAANNTRLRILSGRWNTPTNDEFKKFSKLFNNRHVID